MSAWVSNLKQLPGVDQWVVEPPAGVRAVWLHRAVSPILVCLFDYLIYLWITTGGRAMVARQV